MYSLNQLTTLLRTSFIFEDLPEEDLTILARSGQVKSYKAGETIMRQSQQFQAFYLVISGRIKLSRISYEGKEQILNLFRPGETFCLVHTFSEEGAPGNFVALKDSTVFVISGNTFKNLVQEEPNLMFKILSILSYKLKQAMDTITSLSLMDVPQRLAAFFVQGASRDKNTGNTVLRLNISQRELAKIIGVAPETMSRVIKKMVEKGFIAVRGREFHILDQEQLQKLSSGELRMEWK